MSVRRYTNSVVVALIVLLMPMVALADEGSQSSSKNFDFGIGFGGYSMVDNEPLTTSTVSFNLQKVLIGASLSFRLGESMTNVLIGGKLLVKVKQKGNTMMGLGGSVAIPTNALGDDTRTSLGFGGGIEQRLTDNVALSADLYPFALAFVSGTTRVGLLSSGAIGVTMYF